VTTVTPTSPEVRGEIRVTNEEKERRGRKRRDVVQICVLKSTLQVLKTIRDKSFARASGIQLGVIQVPDFVPNIVCHQVNSRFAVPFWRKKKKKKENRYGFDFSTSFLLLSPSSSSPTSSSTGAVRRHLERHRIFNPFFVSPVE